MELWSPLAAKVGDSQWCPLFHFLPPKNILSPSTLVMTLVLNWPPDCTHYLPTHRQPRGGAPPRAIRRQRLARHLGRCREVRVREDAEAVRLDEPRLRLEDVAQPRPD